MLGYHEPLRVQRAILWLAMAWVLAGGVLGQDTPGSTPEKPPSPLRATDEKSWKIKEKAEAVAQAKRALGLSLPPDAAVDAEIVKLEDDNTPFLSRQVVGIPLWKMTIHDQLVALPSVPREYQAKERHTFDVYVDPVDGRVLMVKSRPLNLAKMLPEPTATVSEVWLGASEEKWHGFPEAPPQITFVGALDSIGSAGVLPLNADQIIAHYVVWSMCCGKHRSPRAVWAIKLRGDGPLLAPSTSSAGPRDNYYYIDAQTGKFLGATGAPRYDYGDRAAQEAATAGQ